MANDFQKWEQGSNFSLNVGFIGMDALLKRFRELEKNVQSRVVPVVLRAGAEVIKARLEAVTPIGKRFYTYMRKSKGMSAAWPIRVRNPHGVGEAKAHVIIYERRAPKGTLFQEASEQSVLIGYEKKHGFWMYFLEYGTERMPAIPFARSTFDASQEEALSAMKQAHDAAMALEDTA